MDNNDSLDDKLRQLRPSHCFDKEKQFYLSYDSNDEL